jgi:rhamnose utilization protein RhaD (predicted bifunctional aldolase and dehydrogenase)
LVQGAGGNTSFKDNDILWVKASGCWLRDAGEKNIFVPVNYSGILNRLNNNEKDPVTPEVLDIGREYNKLRPSIETSLHALMPHRYVIHTHSVNILANVITKDGKDKLSKMLKGLRWAWVPYVRPGLPLTLAVKHAAKSQPDILILENHGIVLGSDSVDEIKRLINDIETRVKKERRVCEVSPIFNIAELLEFSEYELLDDLLVQSVAFDSTVLSIVKNGINYPDHVVFLGVEPLCILNTQEFDKYLKESNDNKDVIIVKDLGVFTLNNLSEGSKAMLNCLANVLLRIDPEEEIKYLTSDEIMELVNWDAEQYRQKVQL